MAGVDPIDPAEGVVWSRRGAHGLATAPTADDESLRVCILDIETRLSAEARSLLPPGDRPTVARSSLLEITAVSVLEFGIGMGLHDVALTTVVTQAVSEGEASALAVVDAALSRLRDRGGLLVSHNGVAHDVPVCARRAMHHWMFEASGIFHWWRNGSGRHVDTMLAFGFGGRGPSLVDLAAGLGFSADVPARSPLASADPLREKVEVDVVCTAICWFHLAAAGRSSPRWMADVWGDLARFLLQPAVRAPHLMPLARLGIGIADAGRV